MLFFIVACIQHRVTYAKHKISDILKMQILQIQCLSHCDDVNGEWSFICAIGCQGICRGFLNLLRRACLKLSVCLAIYFVQAGLNCWFAMSLSSILYSLHLLHLMLKPFASTLGTRPPHHSVAPLTAPIMVKFYVNEEGFRPEFRFMWLSYYSKARFLKSISGGSFLGVLGNGKPEKLQFLSVPCLFLHSN